MDAELMQPGKRRLGISPELKRLTHGNLVEAVLDEPRVEGPVLGSMSPGDK
jgi:hypothetical protein